MKKILFNRLLGAGGKLLFFVTAFALTSTGCSKKFLDIDKQGAQPAAELFKTQDDATNAVNAIYGNLRSWTNTSFAPICVESVPSDDAEKGSVPSDATFINTYDNFTVTAADGQLNDMWSGQYQNINLCNQVLDSVPPIAMDATLKARYLAEAKFVRAYSYFRLVRAFGNVPLVLSVPLSVAAQNPPQVPAATVWAAIEQDLTDAEAVLPTTYGASDIGRATKGAALTLHAKAAMYQKKWTDVLNYTTQVMALPYSLFPNFEKMFRIENENCSESIFEIQANYDPNNSDLSNCQYSQTQGNRDANAGWGFNVPTADLVNAFETGDPRLQGAVMMAGTTTAEGDVVPEPSAGAPSRYNMKTYVPFALAVVDNQGADQNKRVFRFAEVLLMNAEANNELGNTAAALASLEMVRARARNNSASPATTLPPVTTTDQGLLRTAIWHERRVEFAMEFDRFFDLVREGQAPAVLGAKGFKAGINEVFPIPQTQIDLSGGTLVQNAGY